MNIERSIKYPFEDAEWLQKILIGGLVNVIPIVNFAGWGYALRALKNVTRGQETPLPEWSEFGDYFVKGLMSCVAVLVYSIPIMIVSCIAWAIDSALGADSPDYVGIFSICGSLISVLYGLFMGVILPSALTKYAVTEEFAVFFRFGEIFGYIGDNLSNYLVALILTVIVSMVANLVGGLVCGIGLLFTVPYGALVVAHLFGQVYNESAQKATA